MVTAVPTCPRCNNKLVASHGEVSCLACGYEPPATDEKKSGGRDYADMAAKANAARSENVRRAIASSFEAHPDWTDAQIAEDSGASIRTVVTYRQENGIERRRGRPRPPATPVLDNEALYKRVLGEDGYAEYQKRLARAEGPSSEESSPEQSPILAEVTVEANQTEEHDLVELPPEFGTDSAHDIPAADLARAIEAGLTEHAKSLWLENERDQIERERDWHTLRHRYVSALIAQVEGWNEISIELMQDDQQTGVLSWSRTLLDRIERLLGMVAVNE